MNTNKRSIWKANLYLDALGSASVIAASALIFLTTSASSISGVALPDTQPAASCAAAPVIHGSGPLLATLAEQAPGGPRVAAPVDCA